MNARIVQRVLVAGALCLSVCACGAPAPEADVTQKEEDVVLQEEETSTPEEEADTQEPEAEATAETKHVGADGVGFVDIPATWVEFQDTDGNTALQWCDGTPYTVVSLDTFDTSGLPEDERASFTPEDAANSVWNNMLNDGAVEDSITGARVTLADRDAVQVYGIHPDGSILVCWLVQDDEGVIRYAAAEGTDETIMDAFDIVNLTYQL